MRQNAGAFPLDTLDAIIVNVAGCGSMLKDYTHIAEELGHEKATTGSDLMAFSGSATSTKSDTAAAHQTAGPPNAVAAFTAKVKDISEFLMELGPRIPTGPIDAVVAYQDACHLQHAQRIRQQPRDLLTLIPGIRLKAIGEPELCCGAAGSYSLTQPEMADRLGQRKVRNLLDVQPDLIVTGNAGCSLQLQAHLKKSGLNVPVLHPMELLDLSYRNVSLAELTAPHAR